MCISPAADRNDALYQLAIVEGMELPLVAKSTDLPLYLVCGWVDGYDNDGPNAAECYLPREPSAAALEWYHLGLAAGSTYWHATIRDDAAAEVA